MNRDEAEKLSILLLQISAKLNQSASFVRDFDSKENWEKYRTAVGRAMGEVYLELEEPLWKRFPDLRPTSMDGPYEVDSKIHEPIFYWPEDENT